MRIMQDKETGKTKLKIEQHLILKNYWEYYIVSDEENTDDIKLAYVMGFENELGCVSMEEIAPYVISQTNNLNQVLPAPGFDWVS